VELMAHREDFFAKIMMLRVIPAILVGNFVHHKHYGIAAALALGIILLAIGDLKRRGD
jgi:hypothetical protein